MNCGELEASLFRPTSGRDDRGMSAGSGYSSWNAKTAIRSETQMADREHLHALVDSLPEGAISIVIPQGVLLPIARTKLSRASPWPHPRVSAFVQTFRFLSLAGKETNKINEFCT